MKFVLMDKICDYSLKRQEKNAKLIDWVIYAVTCLSKAENRRPISVGDSAVDAEAWTLIG